MAIKIKPRKARGDSKLDALPPAQLSELVQGLLCGWTYTAALDWLNVECGVCVSLSSFTPFFSRHVEPILVERKKFAALSAKTLAKLAAESEAFDAAAIGELKEYAYRLIRDPNSDPQEARAWIETMIKVRNQDEAIAKRKQAGQTKAEAGIEALTDEAKGNAEAQAALKAYIAAIHKKP